MILTTLKESFFIYVQQLSVTCSVVPRKKKLLVLLSKQIKVRSEPEASR